MPARHPRWFRELVYRKNKKRYAMVWQTERRWAGTCRQFSSNHLQAVCV